MKALDKSNWLTVELEIVSSDESQITFKAGGALRTLTAAQFNAAYKSMDGKPILPSLSKVRVGAPTVQTATRPAAGPAAAPPAGSPSSPATLAHVREIAAQLNDIEDGTEKTSAGLLSLRTQLETMSAQVAAIFKTICEVAPDPKEPPAPPAPPTS